MVADQRDAVELDGWHSLLWLPLEEQTDSNAILRTAAAPEVRLVIVVHCLDGQLRLLIKLGVRDLAHMHDARSIQVITEHHVSFALAQTARLTRALRDREDARIAGAPLDLSFSRVLPYIVR